MDTTLNTRVKHLCMERGIQLKDLASKIGIAPESLSRAINGNPQLFTIKNIAAALDVSISELFEPTKQFLCVLMTDDGVSIFDSTNDIPTIINTLSDIQSRKQG